MNTHSTALPDVSDFGRAVLCAIHRSEASEGAERFGRYEFQGIAASFGMKHLEAAKELQRLWENGYLTEGDTPYSPGASLNLSKCRLSALGQQAIGHPQEPAERG